MYVEAPENCPAEHLHPSIFLAGGITNCPDWQADAVALLPKKATVFNPRRKNFPINEPGAAKEQIEWEYRYLNTADVVLFWFAASTLQPIVLLEYGAYALSGRKDEVVVGVDPKYRRRSDILIQTALFRRDLKVHPTLQRTVSAAISML